MNRRKTSVAAAAASPPTGPLLDAEQALMLDLLGQAPVMFHRAYVGLAGTITGALWLSYAMGRRAEAIAALQEAGETIDGPVWFSVSREECEEGTGLTRHQQDTARRDLRDLGVVLEERRSTMVVAINTRRLGQMLMAQSKEQWGDRIKRSGMPQPRSVEATPAKRGVDGPLSSETEAS